MWIQPSRDRCQYQRMKGGARRTCPCPTKRTENTVRLPEGQVQGHPLSIPHAPDQRDGNFKNALCCMNARDGSPGWWRWHQKCPGRVSLDPWDGRHRAQVPVWRDQERRSKQFWGTRTGPALALLSHLGQGGTLGAQVGFQPWPGHPDTRRGGQTSTCICWEDGAALEDRVEIEGDTCCT